VDRTTKFIHENRDVRTYRSWDAMLGRCHGRSPSRKNYGARGIRVCDRWRFGEGGKHPYQCFLEDMGVRPPDKTLDRKENDGNYEPDNCRWATRKEQDLNKRKMARIPIA